MGRWFRSRSPRGQARAPKTDFSAKSISSGGLGAGGSCHTFSESGQRGKKNVGSGILIFGTWPEKTGPEGGAGRWADQHFGISTFFIKGTPAKIRRQSFSVSCNFLIRRTPRAPRVPRGPGDPGRGENQKSKLGLFFIEGTPPKIQILRTFCFIQHFDSTHP